MCVFVIQLINICFVMCTRTKRENLANNLVHMHEEANKFREHQAREILIGTLQRQVDERRRVLDDLNEQILKADEALKAALYKF
mmetsp:Transcript_7523/g.16297  ORF Transcript_7523/g.16297 Transcript_7523/m.16297 type:complete len:84 (-) Transcript_7523:463-714(-)